MSTLSITQNPLTDMMRIWGGVKDVREAHTALAAANVKSAGSLLAHLGVSQGQLERLGLSSVNAKAVLNAEGWRGALNVSKQLSGSLTSSGGSMLESLRAGGWGSFEQQMPNLAKSAKSACDTVRGAATGLVGRAGDAVKAAKAGGFFSGIFESVSKLASPILGPISKVCGPIVETLKPLARFLPVVNLIFVAADGYAAIKGLFDPKKSWGEKAALFGKFGLSLGAALPIPGAQLLGGARGAWAAVDGVNSLRKHLG